MNWMNFLSFLKRILKLAVQFIGGWVAMLNFQIYFGLLGTFFAFLVVYCLIIQRIFFSADNKLWYRICCGCGVYFLRRLWHNLIAMGKSSARKYQGHQEKPCLLICGNKCWSALVSKGQADFDWPAGISLSQWYISQQSAGWPLVKYLFSLINYWCFTNPTAYKDQWELVQKDYLRDMRVQKSIWEWVYIKRCGIFKDIAWWPWDRCLRTKFWEELDAQENEGNRNDAYMVLSLSHQAQNLE